MKLTRRGDDLEAGTPRTVFRFPAGIVGSDLTRDGYRMIVTSPSAAALPATLRVVLDWTALLKR